MSGMANSAKRIYEFSVETLEKKSLQLDAFKGKVVLIENVASLWGTTTRDYTQMNQLQETFGDRLQILAFPCNQFGHQENGTNDEILTNLKHVRPGNGYVPKFPVLGKVEVNGANAHPLFEFLRTSLPVPSDESTMLMGDPKFIIWSPVCRNDISWNFEKFLVDKDGVPFKRYSRHFLTTDIKKDIENLLKK